MAIISTLTTGGTIKGTGDGRYYNNADDLDRYAAVFNWDEDTDQGDLLGFVQL